MCVNSARNTREARHGLWVVLATGRLPGMSQGRQQVTQNFETREEWLAAAVEALRPVWLDRAGLTVPEVRVGVGFPSGGVRSAGQGQCWKRSASADGVNEITIRVTVLDAVEALSILGHELVHAAWDNQYGHGKKFARALNSLGFIGNPKSSVAGATLSAELATLADALGDYPGDEGLTVAALAKKQGTRMLACTCETCGFKFRTTVKWIVTALGNGGLRCPDSECDGVVSADYAAGPVVAV